MTLTDRELQILRLMDAGLPLVPNGIGAVFHFDAVSPFVRNHTVSRLVQRELLVLDPTAGRFQLTETAREHLAVRVRVRDFATEATEAQET